MADEHINADAAFVFQRDVFTREGAEAAVQAAQDMIAVGAAWIAQEHGPDEARRVLQTVQAAQRKYCRPRGGSGGQLVQYVVDRCARPTFRALAI
jgi:hypothetical protein